MSPIPTSPTTPPWVFTNSKGIELLREAVATLGGSPAELERAHALAGLGQLLLAESHRVAARDPLRAALDLADRCGATALERRVRSLLAASGARPRRARTSGRDCFRKLGVDSRDELAEKLAG